MSRPQMNRDDIRKLLGGYATGTLTPGEQEALFEAALQDQELFDALAREQSLRDLLRDPAAKAQLLAALDERPLPWYRRLGWWRPAAAVVAMAGLSAVVVTTVRNHRAPQTETVARVNPPPAELRPAPVAPQMLDQVVAAPPKQKATAVNRRYSAPAPAPAAAPATEAETKPAASVAVGALSAGLRDAPQPGRRGGSGGGGGGSVGGVVGGVIGGIAGGTPGRAVPPAAQPQFQAAPPAPDARNTVMVEAAGQQVQVAAVSDAKTLFFGVPPAVQSFAPRQGAQNQTIDGAAPAPAQQQVQQGQQGTQQAAQNQLARAVAQSTAKTLQIQQPANPGVRYRIVPQFEANGQPAGTVRLEFTANDNGTLTVTSAGQTLVTRTLARMAPYTTEPLTPRGQELTVVFSRQSAVSVTRAEFDARKDALKKDAALQRSDSPEGTYVVADPASPQVTFTITLKQ